MRERPLLVVPPVINKYYIVDLAPGRSLVEYLVSTGQQVFMISWRNPDVRHRDWDLDTYGEAILAALAAARDITGADSALLLGAVLGRDPGRHGGRAPGRDRPGRTSWPGWPWP